MKANITVLINRLERELFEEVNILKGITQNDKESIKAQEVKVLDIADRLKVLYRVPDIKKRMYSLKSNYAKFKFLRQECLYRHTDIAVKLKLSVRTIQRYEVRLKSTSLKH